MALPYSCYTFDVFCGNLWASLVAQVVENLPAVWENWVRSLGWEDPLEEGMATHSNILAWRIPIVRGAWQATVHGVTKSRTWLSNEYFHSFHIEPHREILSVLFGALCWNGTNGSCRSQTTGDRVQLCPSLADMVPMEMSWRCGWIRWKSKGK